MPKHRTTLKYHPLGFQARCTCGWHGGAQTVEDLADEEAEAHEVTHLVNAAVTVALLHGGVDRVADAEALYVRTYGGRAI